MNTTELPPTSWTISVWPKPMHPDDDSMRLRLNEMRLMRVGNVLAPEQFSMGIEIPELGSVPDGIKGMIVSFRTKDCGLDWEKEGGIEITMLIGAYMDLETVLRHVEGVFPMRLWRRYALEQIVLYLARNDIRRHVPELQTLDKGAEASSEDAPDEKPRKRFKITQGHLRSVVQVYRDAVEEGRPPTREVAEAFGVAHSTAAKWVGAARREGMLEGVAQKWASKTDSASTAST